MLSHITMFQPSAVDNALSVMQIIHKLIKEMNIVIDEVNSIDSKANEYTDSEILKLKNNLEAQINLLNGRVTDLDNNVSNYITLLNEVSATVVELQIRLTQEVGRLDTKIDNNKIELLERISNLYNLLKNYIDSEISNIILYVEELIKKRTVIVYDTYDGKKRPFEKMMYNQLALLTDIASPVITVNELKQIINRTSMNVDGTGKSFNTLTYKDLMDVFTVWEASLNQPIQVYIQKTSNGEQQPLPLVLNNFRSAKKNNFAVIYALFYRMLRLYDVGNRVVPYTFYSALNMYVGLDKWNCNTLFSTNL